MYGDKEETPSDFEIEIYAEMHNAVKESDNQKLNVALSMILVKLISLIDSVQTDELIEGKTPYQWFRFQLTSINSLNYKIKETTVFNKNGWEIEDTNKKFQIPSTINGLDTAMETFQKLQYREANNQLNALLIDLLSYLMKKKIFKYNSSHIGETYFKLIGGGDDYGR